MGYTVKCVIPYFFVEKLKLIIYNTNERRISMLNTIPWYYILIYFVIINLIAIFMFWLDKRSAKKHEWRISEKDLLIITALGGWFGSIYGMYKFRHKTKKKKFTIGIPLIFAIELVIFIYLCYNGIVKI